MKFVTAAPNGVLKYVLFPQAEFEKLSGNELVFDFEGIMLSSGSISTWRTKCSIKALRALILTPI
jgi:hypothetical protein